MYSRVIVAPFIKRMGIIMIMIVTIFYGQNISAVRKLGPVDNYSEATKNDRGKVDDYNFWSNLKSLWFDQFGEEIF